MEMEDMTHDATAESIRRCADGLTAYASALAVNGMDDLVEDMRWLVNWITEFWLAGIEKDGWLKIREQYTSSFCRSVSEAKRTGQVPPLTTQMREDILNGLQLHAQELDDMGDHEAFVDWCRELCAELPAAWEHNRGHQCRRPDTGGLELKLF